MLIAALSHSLSAAPSLILLVTHMHGLFCACVRAVLAALIISRRVGSGAHVRSIFQLFTFVCEFAVRLISIGVD